MYSPLPYTPCPFSAQKNADFLSKAPSSLHCKGDKMGDKMGDKTDYCDVLVPRSIPGCYVLSSFLGFHPRKARLNAGFERIASRRLRKE